MNRDNIFYYRVSDDISSFAYWHEARSTHSDIGAMWNLLELGVAPDISGWTSVISLPTDLDVKIDGTDPALIIVEIPESTGPNQTHFGRSAPVQPLEIAGLRGGAGGRVIRRSATYPRSSSQPLLASFEVHPAQTRNEVRHHHPHAGDDHNLVRFPFAFNFIDSADGVSPVMKHHHSAGGLPKNHGGIHPRGGTSLIIIE